MNFEPSDRVRQLQEELLDFMSSRVFPAETIFREQREAAGDVYFYPPVMEDLKKEARERGLWNLFLPDEHYGAGLTNLDYAPLAEITGHSVDIAPEALNCSAPDSGNMEILNEFGTEEQRDCWLVPLLQGDIRSCFAMTEPQVASSDPANIETRIEPTGSDYVINGRKWWTSGALSPRCEFAIVMGVTDPDADRHRRHTMIVVPLDTPGVTVERSLPVFGYQHGNVGGHAEVRFEDVRVPAGHVLGGEGMGFAIGQARLGPGRIHHCMRLLGVAERSFALMCARAQDRTTFGKRLAEQGVVQDWVAEARMRIEQARLLVLKTAWLMDTVGNKGARIEISAIKVAVPEVVRWIVDRAIQIHGGAGVSDDLPLAEYYALARTVQIADGPDEVHKMALSRRELRRFEEGRSDGGDLFKMGLEASTMRGASS